MLNKSRRDNIANIVLLLVWVVVQLSVFLHFGIVTKGEGLKYTKEAIFFQNNHWFSEPKYIFYAVYILIRWFDQFIQSNNWFTYILQLSLNFWAIRSFYTYTVKLFSSTLYGTVATLLLLACYPWQAWTAHLYTESIFLSVCLLLAIYFTKNDKSKSDWILFWVLLLLLVFTRPTGLLFLPVIGLIAWEKAVRLRKWALVLLFPLLAFGSFYFLLNHAMKGEGEFDFMKPFIEEHLVCGVSGNFRNDLVLPKDGNSVEGLFFYMSNNFGHFTGLAIKKMILFFGLTRSYYSSGHNLALQLFFYPLYLLALLGFFWGRKKYRPVVMFSCYTIVLFALSVVFSCDDWLNRFIMPVLPLIVLMAATGIKELLNRLPLRKATTI